MTGGRTAEGFDSSRQPTTLFPGIVLYHEPVRKPTIFDLKNDKLRFTGGEKANVSMGNQRIKGQLARGRRPGGEGKRGRQVPRSVVDDWIREAKAQAIRSIICLLDERQLRFYEELPVDLVSYYRSRGLNVVHINAPNMRKPPYPTST